MRRVFLFFVLLSACRPAVAPPREVTPAAVVAPPLVVMPADPSAPSLAETKRRETFLRLVRTLQATTSRDDAVPVMRELEMMFGLPAFYEPHAMQCGASAPDMEPVVRAWRAAEDLRFAEGKRGLLRWLTANALLPPDQRVRAAFLAWDAHHWIAQPDRWPEGVGTRAKQRYATIIALGDAALPELSSRKHETGSDKEAALYEILIAAISGKYDEALVGRLLSPQSYDKELGEEIVSAAQR